jgi:hypothetical protein
MSAGWLHLTLVGVVFAVVTFGLDWYLSWKKRDDPIGVIWFLLPVGVTCGIACLGLVFGPMHLFDVGLLIVAFIFSVSSLGLFVLVWLTAKSLRLEREASKTKA